jgi:DNA-binding winged helix-turn-helix (wHTH) protein/tetratricopeptide (TPR) repeat protein
MVVSFGQYELDEGCRELRRDGAVARLEPQVFDVLAHLVRHRDRVVTKIELLDEVWGTRYVGESALTSRIKSARQAVGDSGREQAVIRTVHGRGFRFVAPVAEQAVRSPSAPVWLAPPPAPEPVPLAGRAVQMARLEAAVEAAAGGTRRVVFITGEAGIGKTALVEALLERLDDLDTLVGCGQCLEQRAAGEPYLGVFDALGRLARQPGGSRVVDVLASVAPTWLLQMPSLVPRADLDELHVRSLGSTPERMLREAVDALETLATDQLLVMLLEDLHWSDDSTADLIDWLARRRDPARLLILCTYRPVGPQATNRVDGIARQLVAGGNAEQIRMDRLRPSDAFALLDAWFPGLPADVATLVQHRTDGVPLFMRDLVASWTDHGDLVSDQGRWRVAGDLDQLAATVPGSAELLVEQELARLQPLEVELLESAAVSGVEFSAATVAAAAGASDDDTEDALTRLARRGLLVAPRGVQVWADGTLSARFTFLHHLHHRVLYNRVPAGRRARLHQAIGERLEAAYGPDAGERVGELALHFDRGGGGGVRAAEYLRRAAEQAIVRGGHHEAVAHLDAALEHLSRAADDPGRARAELSALTVLATALIATRGWAAPEVEAAYLRASELCRHLGDPPERCLVLYGVATVHELRGRYQQSEALLEQQLAAGPPDLEIETFELLACSTFHQGAFDKAVTYASRGLALYDHDVHSVHLARYGEHPGVSCHAWAGLALWFLGRPAESHAHIDAALELGADHPYALTTARIQAAFLHQYRNEPNLVLDWADATIELATDQGFPFRIAQGRILRGWAIGVSGDREHGLRELRAGLVGYRATGAEMDWPYLLGLLADALLNAGQEAEALTTVDEALAMVATTRAFFHEPELHRIRGRALLALAGSNALDDVRAALRRGLDVAERQHSAAARLRLLTTSHDVEANHRHPSGTHDIAAALAEFHDLDGAPDLVRARELVADANEEQVGRAAATAARENRGD